MKLPPLLPLFTFLIFSTATAGIVDRVRLADPRSQLIDAGPGAVVASGSGNAFLVHGQRITRDGEQIDDEPIAGADGVALGWRKGWMLIDIDHDRLRVKHLGESGLPESKYAIPALGEFLDAASVDGRIAILERVYDVYPSSIWLTIASESGWIQRRRLAALSDGRIARYRNGFLVITEIGSTLQAWMLDAQGQPQNFRQIGNGRMGDQLVISGDHALFRAGATGRVINASLEPSAFIDLIPQPVTGLSSIFALPIEGGFLVSYSLRRSDGTTESRAVRLATDGAILEDTSADPIVAADRTSDRYLVLRPWGHAGLASGDPRKIFAAFHLKRHRYENLFRLDSIVSGDVTLVTAIGDYPWSPFFIRVDSVGTLIDPEPLPFDHARIAATPEGFVFLSDDGSKLRLRRLARRGGWIDERHLNQMAATPARYAAHSNGRDLLIVAVTREEVSWARFSFEGASLDASPRRIPRTRPNWPFELGISSRGDDRLIVIQETFPCQLGPCPVPPLHFNALALDGEAAPLGPWNSVSSYTSKARAIAHFDGTWLVPIYNFGAEVVQLAHDGTPLGRLSIPMLDGGIVDIDSTPSGWKAIVDRPLRVVEIDGVNQIRSVTGLSEITSPRFAGDRLVFLAESTTSVRALAPWSGRIAASDGDLAITLSRLTNQGPLTRVRVAIRNEGVASATNVSLMNLYGTLARITSLAPGEVRYLDASVNAYDRLYVYSDDIADVDPADNSALVSEAAPYRRTRAARP